MALVGLSDRTYHKPRVDVVAATLIRLVITVKAAYREPLVDALYQYRRREGIFINGRGVLPLAQKRTHPAASLAPRKRPAILNVMNQAAPAHHRHMTN